MAKSSYRAQIIHFFLMIMDMSRKPYVRNQPSHRFIDWTQIYAEMSQDSVDKKLKEWNDTWFGSKIEMKESKKDIPDFLKKK